MERFIAGWSPDAALIWKLKRDTPPAIDRNGVAAVAARARRLNRLSAPAALVPQNRPRQVPLRAESAQVGR